MSDPATSNLAFLQRFLLRTVGVLVIIASFLIAGYALLVLAVNGPRQEMLELFIYALLATLYGAGLFRRSRWVAIIFAVLSTILSTVLLLGLSGSRLPMANILLAGFFLLPILIATACWREFR